MNWSATQEESCAKASTSFQGKAAAAPTTQAKRYPFDEIGKVQTGVRAERGRRRNVLLFEMRHQPAPARVSHRGNKARTAAALSSPPAQPASHQVLAETAHPRRTHPQRSRTQRAQRRTRNAAGGNLQLQPEVWRALWKIGGHQEGPHRSSQCHLRESNPFLIQL